MYKPRIQEQGTECRERGEWGKCYILGNTAKHSGECPQTFRQMSPNILGNVPKHSRGMSSNIHCNIFSVLLHQLQH